MAEVSVTVNGHAYVIGCDDGEEEHLQNLAAYVDRHVQQLAESVGQVGEARLMLMAALLVADELSDVLARIEELKTEMTALREATGQLSKRADMAESRAAESITKAARRIEEIAGRLTPS
jgi:cell division protein ZapA